jgi:hypothetical protein
VEGDSRYSVHFVKLVRRGDLSGVISDAELASLTVQFVRSIDLSEGTSDAEFASLTVRFLRSVCERFVEKDDEFRTEVIKETVPAYGSPPEPSRARHRRTLRVSASA